MTKYRPVKLSDIFDDLMMLEQVESSRQHRYLMRFNDAEELESITKESLENAIIRFIAIRDSGVFDA